MIFTGNRELKLFFGHPVTLLVKKEQRGIFIVFTVDIELGEVQQVPINQDHQSPQPELRSNSLSEEGEESWHWRSKLVHQYNHYCFPSIKLLPSYEDLRVYYFALNPHAGRHGRESNCLLKYICAHSKIEFYIFDFEITYTF